MNSQELFEIKRTIKEAVRPIRETRDEELLRLRRFKERVFATIDKYVNYLASSEKQCEILRDLRAELWEHQ